MAVISSSDYLAHVLEMNRGNPVLRATAAGFRGAYVEAAKLELTRRGRDSRMCTYHSPSLGRIGFGWLAPLTVNGSEIAIKDYLRYDNPYCKAEFGERKQKINCGKESYIIGR